MPSFATPVGGYKLESKMMEQLNLSEEMKVVSDFSDKALPPSVYTFRPLLFHDGDSYRCVFGASPMKRCW